MTAPILKPLYVIQALGELGQMPDGAVTNIGGTSSPTFSVGGRGLLFDDGSSTLPGTGGGYTLQVAYTNSTAPATINLTTGKDFVLNALNGKKFIFDAATGTLTIEGDLTVLGSSTVIEGTVSNLDQVNISPPSSTTVGLTIVPLSGVTPAVNLMGVKAVAGGPDVFTIGPTGLVTIPDASIQTLNGVAVSDLLAHINSATDPAKHTASQISVAPIAGLTGDTVQEVLENLGTIAGGGTVTSVAIVSDDLSVSGSPITTSGTISINLGVIPISKGGTGQTTATGAIAALLPAQALNAGKVLGTDGTTVSWVDAGAAIILGPFFTNVEPTSGGIVGDKVYLPGTTPPNSVVAGATTDTENVTVSLLVEAASIYTEPTVTVTTTPAQAGGPITVELTQDPDERKIWTGTFELTGITADTVVRAATSTGQDAVLNLTVAPAAPTLTALAIGPYPFGQTAVKEGDTVTVTGTATNSATEVVVLAQGAAGAESVLTVGPADSAGAGFRTVSGSFTVSGGTGAQAITARPRNSFGTLGAAVTSSNTVILDQVIPVIGVFSVVYPEGQDALKDNEGAQVSAVVTNFTSVTYTGVNLAIINPTSYALTKTAVRTGGDLVVGVDNYTITALRATNGSSATASTAVAIANTTPAASITISGGSRLSSSPAGTPYTVTLTATQPLAAAPTLLASSGNWQGAWTGAGTTWSRTLSITDASPKGPQSFSGLQATSLAGRVGTTITSGASYTVGGFEAREVIFPPFERWAPIGTTVTDVTKLSVTLTGASPLTFFPDTNSRDNGFSIVDALGNYNAAGGFIFLSDGALAGANTSGSLSITIQEDA